MISEQPTADTLFDPQARIFKLLTHPARIAILEILREGEHCVCHLEAHLGYRQAYISQQLTVLRAAGLVEDRRDGWNIFYRVVAPGIYELLDASGRLTGHSAAEFRSRQAACTCPHCSGKDSPAKLKSNCD